MSLPECGAGRRRAVTGVLPLGVCEHVDAGAVREQAESRVLLPDRRRPRMAARAAEGAHARLQRPDALEHLDPRGVPGSLPALPASAAGRVEGAEVDALRAGVVRRRLGALLRADDDRRPGSGAATTPLKLGQLAEALVRLARFVVAIRLHCEDLSVEQGMRFFRDEAFLEEATARREAERGTFDPTYLVYSVGKLMLLKLRRDYKEQQAGKFSLRDVPRRRARAGQRAVLGAPPPAARRRVGRRSWSSAQCLCTSTSATRAASGSR